MAIGKNDRNEKLAKRIADLEKWVRFEMELPEDDQVPLARLDALVRTYLGEFTQRALQRAQRDVALTAMVAEATR